jgi:hypothetical protein
MLQKRVRRHLGTLDLTNLCIGSCSLGIQSRGYVYTDIPSSSSFPAVGELVSYLPSILATPRSTTAASGPTAGITRTDAIPSDTPEDVGPSEYDGLRRATLPSLRKGAYLPR